MDVQQFLAKFGHIANAPGGVARLRELILHLAVSGDLVTLDSSINAAPLLKAIESQKLVHPERKKVVPRQTSVPQQIIKVPPHWAICRLGDLTLTITGGGTPSKNYQAYWGGEIPWASVKDLKDLKYLDDTEDHITIEGLNNSSSNLIPPNRIIVCTRMGLGKVVINRVAMAINQDLKALELPPEVNSDFFLILYKTREVKGTGTTVAGIKQEQLLALPAALPPLEEQALIVAKVDELMTLCDTLEQQQQQRRKLQNALRQSTLQAVATATSPHELQTTWTRLSDNFGQLFSAPEDVLDLRNLILDLAVHGLLVHQSDSDESINDWISLVSTKKTDLVKQKLIPKQTAVAEIKEEEYPFSPPQGWTFVRLGQITSKIGSGSTPRGGREVYVKEGIPFLRSQNIWNDGLRLRDVVCITTDQHKKMSGTAVEGNDVLLNITGASLGRCALVPPEFGEANVSQHVTIIRLIDPQIRDYLHLCILSPYTQSMIWGRQVGMAREGLSKKVFEQFEIPLPPIAEQHRIVARVSELMRLCDTLENQLLHANELAERFAIISIASLTGMATEQEEEPMKAPQTELIAPLRLDQTPDIKAQAPLATLLIRHNGEMSAKDLWQRFGGEIDAFYAQLKAEVAHGWIREPEPAEMRQLESR